MPCHLFRQTRRSQVASTNYFGEYLSADTERYLAEPAKRPGRSEFARDRARILHSAALRRLAAKTQVEVPWESDFARTRLSHSLECGQVGRELGAALGADPDLVESACLAHDLGHPPFGHNGEVALEEAAQDCGGFEGNAQSFRILTRLEAKSVDVEGASIGLNLSRATLDGASKYPWTRATNSKKFGVYDDDRAIFDWMRAGRVGTESSIEAQIMDWSDDVAYSVHDLEDALVAERFPLAALSDTSEQRDVARVALESYAADSTENELQAAFGRLTALPYWPSNFSGTHRDHAALKDLTSQLIGRFALAAERETRAKWGSGSLIRFGASLEVPREERIEVAVLKAIAAHYVMRSDIAQARYSEQRILIHELVEALWQGGPSALEPTFHASWDDAANDGERRRVVIDQVASLTDVGARLLHGRLTGRGE
ncbi:MAG: deoxyguanosinetriphosphate triphosphohydrolase [Actinobacteria bacterium]|nr:deoxyguanosinetriphosphate triphosphohydrolase [Actinomycetota bacterium]MSY51770.1 deoxyguanosinetriphosphate triphosphohydrolase [Actinomycetota bacterium]MSY87482.1 deoxyguanosinetriphosphate triphosphohydrolase [Actinomycetota bacterium]MTA51114.1 deoxyguanosinetriphosphate triphosphohydrolase [Actinomycetota bacterium]